MKRESDNYEKEGKKKKQWSMKTSTSTEPSPCTECGKKFWSWKALFGHMRCHPERKWRGINPPPNVKVMRRKEQEEMTEEEHEVAACLLLLSNAREEDIHFECSNCNKVFESHQILGGHRACHKNVKDCFASNNGSDHQEDNMNNMSGGGGHQCSICLRVFSTGQALGGHKRCHWDKGGGGNIHSHNNTLLLLDNLNFPPFPHPSTHSPPPLPLTLNLRLGL